MKFRRIAIHPSLPAPVTVRVSDVTEIDRTGVTTLCAQRGPWMLCLP